MRGLFYGVLDGELAFSIGENGQGQLGGWPCWPWLQQGSLT